MAQIDPYKYKILIVDDSQQDLTMLNKILSAQGYVISAAINGGLALKAVHNFVPDLILLDVMMPDMNGYDLCQQLKSIQSLHDVPVLFISILEETVDKVKAFESGGVDYICKPFQVEEVLARVKTHLSLRAMQTQLEVQNMQLRQEIAERKRVEEQLELSLKEKNVLLKEIHHRVKNNLQVISSLLKFQAERISEPHILDMFQDCQYRIRTMSIIHEQLYQNNNLAKVDVAGYIHALATSVFRACGTPTSGISLKIHIDQVEFDIDTAVACGLIISELVVNALKYAFPAEQPLPLKKEIQIMLHSDGRQRWQLSVRDTGVGFPDSINFRETDSLGLQLVCLLTKQLVGCIQLENTGGTTFTITFPNSNDRIADNTLSNVKLSD